MQDLAFWKAVIVDESNSLETMVALLAEHHVRYCVIGGQGVNAYVDPLVSLDLDLVLAAEDVEPLESLLREQCAGSKLRVQVQTDPRYATFLDRARPRQVLGLTLRVANLEDILQGKFGLHRTRSVVPASGARICWISSASWKPTPRCARRCRPKFWSAWLNPDTGSADPRCAS